MSKARYRIAKSRLRKMIEEAVVDCYTEEEQHESFVVMLQEHLPYPVEARVMGEEVTVLGFDREDSLGEILAKCRHGKRTYSINVTALEWPGQAPKGGDWIEAYRACRKGFSFYRILKLGMVSACSGSDRTFELN